MVTSPRGGLGVVALLLLAGCGGTPNVSQPNLTGGVTGGSGGSSAGGDGGSSAGGNGGSSGSKGGSGGTVSVGGSGGTDAGSGGTGGGVVDPCKNTECGEGQRCEADGDDAECVDNSCDDIDCGDSELCVSATGGGHVCIDKCKSDAACPEDQF